MTFQTADDRPAESRSGRELGRSLAAIAERLADDRERLFASVADVSDDDLYRRAAPDAWSVGEILDHLHRVESSIAGLVAVRVREAKAAGTLPPLGQESDEEVAAALGSLDRYRIDTVTRRVVAAEASWPQGVHSKGDLLDALRRSRATLLDALAAADGYDLTALRHAHRSLGELDLRQWVLFVGAHERRHAKQVEAVKQAIGAGPDGARLT